MNKDIQRIISKIVDKSAEGDYIYRGEPKCYEKVSSSLWRECQKEMGEVAFNIEGVQKGMLVDAKKHIGELSQKKSVPITVFPGEEEADTDEQSDFETLAELQHYGGQTNLIDFTNDYFIALFFACDGKPHKDGRVILQRREEISNIIENPRNPRHRVITQKSVFIRPPQGFIEPQEDDIITIPKELKEEILDFLRKYHYISTETIYNDLHGFIKNQNIHQKAYMEFYIGLDNANKGHSESDHRIKQQFYDKAISHYDSAIKLNKFFLTAYNNRAAIYYRKGKYDYAITDFNTAITLNPNYADAYNNRAAVYHVKGEYECAIKDSTQAINLRPNYVRGVHKSPYRKSVIRCVTFLRGLPQIELTNIASCSKTTPSIKKVETFAFRLTGNCL